MIFLPSQQFSNQVQSLSISFSICNKHFCDSVSTDNGKFHLMVNVRITNLSINNCLQKHKKTLSKMTSNRLRNNNEIVVRRRKIKNRTNWRHRHTSLSVLQWANVKKLHTDISSLCQSISKCVVLLSTLSSILRTSTGSDELVLLVCRRFYVLNIHLIRILMVSLSQSISKVNDIIYAPLSEFNIPLFPPHKNRTIDELSED